MSALRLCCALVLAPALAVAQATPVRTARAVQEPAPATGDPAPVAGADSHTVQRGDTLWDLSARYLNSPWYWPKVWSYNPEIGNPHWIYPGAVVRLRPGAPQAAPGPVLVEEDEPGRDLDDDVVTVGGPYRIGFTPRVAVRARRESFVTQTQVEESGILTAAFEDKSLLTLFDRAYARFPGEAKVRPGATYMLYRTDGAIRHPLTGELFGYQSTVLGAARVVAVDAEVATLEVTQAFDPIERGTLVGTWTEAAPKAVQARPNRRSLSGVIVAAQQGLVSTLGEHHVVFVDKGRTDGVEEGNVFTVIRAGDPYGRDTVEQIRQGPEVAGLPIEDVGVLMVVDARETSSAALIVRSMRELYVGDKVEMRAPLAQEPDPSGPSGSRRSAERR